VLDSIEVAFAILNSHHAGSNGRRHTPDNTVVIASGVSNGGGAALRAAEMDRSGLIDGIAVSEPNVTPVFDPSFTIRQGGQPPLSLHSRPLFDTITLVNLYASCAALAVPDAPMSAGASAGRCEGLSRNGLLKSAGVPAQAAEAQAVIESYGILADQNYLQPAYGTLFVPQSIAVTYANAYARAGVERNLCDYSFAYAGKGVPAPLPPDAAADLFATGNGIPPTGKVVLINNNAPGGPREDRSSTPDQNLPGALCLRELATRPSAVFRDSLDAIRATGALRGKPVVIVNGRADGIIPPNHASRPYYAVAQKKAGAGNVRYYEVTNATHLDAFNAFPGFDARYVPLHHYYFQALDLMWDHLVNGAPLPPAQVVHTVPRGPRAPAIRPANLPPIRQDAAEASLVRFTGMELTIPE